MLVSRPLYFLLSLLILVSCAKDNLEDTAIKEKSLELQVLEVYDIGKDALESGDVLYAAKKFNEVETLFPQSDLAPRSALMAAYSYYIQDYYGDTIAELERFIRVYPFHKDIPYAHYLMGISYFEQIVDEKKDLQSIKSAKTKFNFILKEYPNTEYALDAEFKISLIDDILASKEMYIGRYYLQKKKWISAINRFRNVVYLYQTTIYVEEALHRLVEINYYLGIKEEANRYAAILGYNYNSSEWYKESYRILNKNYKVEKKDIVEEKEGILKRIINKIRVN